MSDEEPVDSKDRLEAECARSSECVGYYRKLVRCTARVKANPETHETCTEELFDLSHCVDPCVAPKLFALLK